MIFITIIILILIKRSRRSELDGEIFEILLTFEDFLEFKQLMLNYKSVIILFILKMILLNFQKLIRFEKNSIFFMFKKK